MCGAFRLRLACGPILNPLAIGGLVAHHLEMELFALLMIGRVRRGHRCGARSRQFRRRFARRRCGCRRGARRSFFPQLTDHLLCSISGRRWDKLTNLLRFAYRFERFRILGKGVYGKFDDSIERAMP